MYKSYELYLVGALVLFKKIGLLVILYKFVNVLIIDYKFSCWCYSKGEILVKEIPGHLKMKKGFLPDFLD